MNNSQKGARSRHSVLCLSIAAILLLSVSLFGQEKTEEPANADKAAAEAKNSDKPRDERENSATNLSPEKPLTRKTFDLKKAEKQSFSAMRSVTKSEADSQQSSGDDTMMGVMGKGSGNLKLGGHVGFVVPIVARSGGVTTNVGDRFVFGFPVGLTLKTKRNIAIDFEFIPTFNTGRDFVLTIHPGIIYGFAKHYAVGVRAAYDAGAGSFGFTPLVSRGFKINDKVGFFVEADFPVRSNYRAYRDRVGSIAFAMHSGFAF